MLNPRFTYQDLLDRQAFLVTTQQANSQTAANRASALRAFLHINRLAIDDPVGDEMRAQWPEALERYLHSLVDLGKSSRIVSNSKAAVRPWRDMVVEADALRAIEYDKPTPFQTQLRAQIGRFSISLVAKTCGISYDMLLGWVHGKRPRQSNIMYINRVENFFGMTRGDLARLAGLSLRGTNGEVADQTPAIEYRGKIVERTKFHYWLKVGDDSALRRQWNDLMIYKTVAVPVLERSSKAQWRISPLPIERCTPSLWFKFIDGKEVPSAGPAWAKVGGFLGWLSLPIDQGGLNIPVDQLQTMAWLIDPALVEKHVEWRRARAGGKLNQGFPDFLGWIQSLVRRDVGYFWQSPWLQDTLPEQYRRDSWHDMCLKMMKFCSRFVQAMKGQIEISRDPFEPLKDVVELDEPMEAVVDMIQRMRADRPIGDPVSEAIWSRDIVLIKLLVSNPLRSRQFAHLTWRPDNTGHLYQRSDGSWWICFKSRFFKNARGAAGDLDYDSPVQQAVWKDLERYLFKHRASLMVAPTDFVFLASRSGPGQKRTSHVPWRDLSSRVGVLTKKYLWRSPGIRAHAMRHLTGTSIVKAAPGEIHTAARVLNDRPLTVQKHYARFSAGDGARRMGELLAKSFRRM